MTNQNYKYHAWDEVSSLFADPQDQIRANFFLTKVLQKQGGYKHTYQDDFFGTYLSSSFLRTILGRNTYRDYLRELEEAGIISVMTKPNPHNANQNLYYLQEFTLKPTEVNVEIPDQYPKINNMIERYYAMRRESLSADAEMQMGSLDKAHIKDDPEQFREDVLKHYPEYVGKCLAGGNSFMSFEEYSQSSESFLHRAQDFNAANNDEKYDFVSEDKFGKRFHSPVTQIPSFMREKGYVTLNGNDTIELDLSESQPSILATLLHEMIPGNDFSTKFFEVEDIYLYIDSQVNPTKGTDKHMRMRGKLLMFIMLYGPVWSEEHKEFCRLFPIAGEAVTEIKKKHNPQNPSQKVHSNLSWILMNTESEIMREVWRVLYDNRVHFLSIHDAILVEHHNLETGKQVMEGVLAKYLVKFKIK
jgi:hypothetical protein